MRFFSRNLLLYTGIVLAATFCIHWLNVSVRAMHSGLGISVWLCYMAVIAASVIILERRDPYQGFFGFNYHFATYVVCICVPLLLHAAGFLSDISFLPGMAGTWGIGVLVHLIILFAFRKRRLRSYDKKEIFE